MCGIVGYVGKQSAAEVLIEGLRRLEYRGYDSAGIAVMNGAGIQRRRAVGKLAALEALVGKDPPSGTTGLGHTRWATHGRPTEENAHPHAGCRQDVAVVHNGIIENYEELKRALEASGHVFRSETDTEVLAHLIEENAGPDPVEAILKTLKQVQGSYALGVIFGGDGSRMIAARKDSPLVLGVGAGEMLLASDVPAVLPYTREIIALEDGELAEITASGPKIWSLAGRSVSRGPTTVHWSAAMAEKMGHRHYMLKEINEQPQALTQTLRGRLTQGRIRLDDAWPAKSAAALQRLTLVACGTSYHAALVARHWFEAIAEIPCVVEVASEYRYRRRPPDPGTGVVVISQSGETADTLAALRDSRAGGLATLAVCNVVGSTVTREAGRTVYTRCGPEIGVASTKAFTGQLAALFLLALHMAQSRRPGSDISPWLAALAALPEALKTALGRQAEVREVARAVQARDNFIYMGRHLQFPVALEGALKLKEISYIHAEGYAAGELKHGPIALIEEGFPVVALATASPLLGKMLSNIEETKARGARVIAVSTDGDEAAAGKADHVLRVPAVPDELSPLVSVIPLQQLAYEVAVMRGCDVDQPRNLAKSVTVE